MTHEVRIERLEDRRLLSAAWDVAAPLVSAFQAPRSAAAEEDGRPSVSLTTPASGATNVDTLVFVVAYVNLPNVGGVTDDPALLAANVRLFRTGDTAANPIPSRVNTTGGGDAVILTPLAPLAPNTEFTFEIAEGLTDDTGAAFIPFQSSFTTGEADDAGPDPTVKFAQVPQPTAAGRRFVGVTVGPDHKLYAGTMDGDIVRFDIAADGNLGRLATVINTVRVNNGGATARRIVTGLHFDPTSSAGDLVLWVSHGDGAESNAPEWSGKISRLSGPNLGEYQDYVVGLPRSVRDHLTQQMDFQPSTGLLFVSQGSNTSMGAPDNAWGLREEQLLTAAILQVDTDAIAERIENDLGPLNVQTAQTETPYDPFVPGAPLTLFATGVRNAFDLVWHSNGSLYVPTNGSAPGGNTPSSVDLPGLTNVRQNQPDLMFKVRKDRYYGHPNPLRNEFILNGANPTEFEDFLEVPDYPVGTARDPEWHGAVYDFGDNRSPDGVIEYKSDTFGGNLKGSLIVCEYSGGDDLVFMRPDKLGNFPAGTVRRGMVGTTALIDPVDLVEDVGPGNLYVVEYGARRITLLKPLAVEPAAPRNVGRAIFNDPVGGIPSPVRKLRIANPNPGDFTVNGISITGPNASMFRITAQPTLPMVLGPDEEIEVSIVFDPPANAPIGIATAGLRAAPSDPLLPALELSLRGLATTGEGGANEPSLQRILDVNELPISAGDNDAGNSTLPFPLATPNDAADDIEGLVKAGSGPVRIELLSVFASPSSPTIKFGHYNPFNNAQTEVLTVAESQRTRPSTAGGSATFDPGTGTFGLYIQAPATGTTAFTEDYRNTFELNASLRQKVLFYPLVDETGEPVADAFVVAFDDSSGGSDYQDFVAIIRNVRAADVPPPAPELTVFADGASVTGGATIDFGTVTQGQPGTEHTLTVRNDGNVDLVLFAVNLPPGFELVQGLSLTTLAPGASDTMRVRLTTATAGKLDALASLASSDADEGTFSLRLTGNVVAVNNLPPDDDDDDDDPPPVVPPILTAGVTGGLPAVVVAGTKTAKGTVSVIVRNNNHTGFTGPATLAVSANSTGLSASETGGSGTTVELMRTTKNLKIKPFSEKVVKLKLSVPSTVPEGEKALSVAVSTSDGRRDVAAGPAFRVAAPVVRLVGTASTAPGGALIFGKKARIRIPLRNDGTVPTTRTPVTYELLVTTSPDSAAAPVFSVASVGRVGLKPGKAKLQSISVTIPPGAFAPGSYFLHVRVSAELNLTNGETLVTLPFSIS